MLCIIIFITFLLFFPIGMFSKTYRNLFKKAWSCAFKKITLKPCDEDFGSEIKNILVGKLFFKFPRVAKFLDKTMVFWAFLFVALSLWSLLYTANAGLNLWVYDTCNPTNGESCSLGGESCGLNTDQAPSILETLSRVPERFKDWQAKEYISESATYFNQYDASKSDAVEFIDPGCRFCKKLWGNIKESGFENKYNLTYVVYPIPQKDTESGYHFPHSYYIASILEAIKIGPKPEVVNSNTPNDWRLLDNLFTAQDDKYKTDLQNAINTLYTREEVTDIIHEYLKEFGYSDTQIAEIEELAKSDKVKDSLEKQALIVTEKVKTVKIPTIIFNNKRYDRVVDAAKLLK